MNSKLTVRVDLLRIPNWMVFFTVLVLITLLKQLQTDIKCANWKLFKCWRLLILVFVLCLGRRQRLPLVNVLHHNKHGCGWWRIIFLVNQTQFCSTTHCFLINYSASSTYKNIMRWRTKYEPLSLCSTLSVVVSYADKNKMIIFLRNSERRKALLNPF